MVLRICPNLEFFPAPRLYHLIMRSQAQGGWSLGAETGEKEPWLSCPDSGTLQGFPGEENVRERMKWDSEVRVCEGRAPPCPGEGSEKPGRLGAAGRVPGRPNQCPSGSPHLQQPWTTQQMMARGHLCTGLTPSGDSKWW